MKQNITLSLDEQTLHQARQLAARRKLSVSKLLAEDIAQHVEADQRYEQAKRQALAWLTQAPLHLDGQYLTARRRMPASGLPLTFVDTIFCCMRMTMTLVINKGSRVFYVLKN